MKIVPITLFLLAEILITYKTYAQEAKKDWERPNWSLSYRFGLPDGTTNDYFNIMHLVGLKKSFNITKPLSLNLLTDFSHIRAKSGTDINAFSLGAGISVYPIYFVHLLKGDTYVPKEDHIYVDFGLQALFKENDFDYLYTMEANIYRFKFKNKSSLSPKVGYNIFISDENVSSNPIYKDLADNTLGFYSAGLAYNF